MSTANGGLIILDPNDAGLLTPTLEPPNILKIGVGAYVYDLVVWLADGSPRGPLGGRVVIELGVTR